MTAYGYQLKTISGPDLEPITLAEAKSQCQIDDDITERDEDLLQYIAAARELAENYTERSFVERTYLLATDAFPSGAYSGNDRNFYLPRGPIIEVLRVSYIEDSTGNRIDATDWNLVEDTPPYLFPAFNTFWPSARCHPGSVQVEYRAGYRSAGSPSDAENVPAAIKQAIRYLVSHWNENREPVNLAGGAPQEVPLTFYDALQPFKTYP